MTAAELLHEIHAEGVQLALTERGNIAIQGAGDQIDKWTPVIKQNKPEMVEVLKTWADLETAIHVCCTARHDSDRHRAALISDCWEEPATEWPVLIRYFLDEAESLAVKDAEVELEASYGRVTCRRCKHLSRNGICRALSKGDNVYTPLEYQPVMLWRRCDEFRHSPVTTL